MPALHKNAAIGFLAFFTHRPWPLAAQAGMPVLPKTHTARGFVARIHRRANGNAANAPAQDSLPGRSNSPSSSIANGNANASASPFARNSSMPDATRQGAMHPAPETHVFSNHNDLTNFLHDQFAEDCK